MNRRFGAVSARVVGLVVGLMMCVFLLAEGITREVPVGAMRGRLVMRENGKPLPGIEITLRERHNYDWEVLQKLPDDQKPKTYVTWSEKDGSYAFHNVKAGDYEIDAYAQAHNISSYYHSVEEGKAEELNLELNPVAPFLDVYSNQHVFQPKEKIELQVHGFVPETEVKFTIFRLNLANADTGHGLYDMFQPITREAGYGGNPAKFLKDKVDEVTKPIRAKTLEGTFQEFFSMPDLSEGDYAVRCASGSQSETVWISISRIGLVTKVANGSLLCFVAQLDNGAPIPGATIYLPKKNKLVPSGTTDANGIASLTLPDNDERVCMAVSGASRALVGFYGRSGSEGDMSRIVMYTDRPIYRPGDDVRYKGIVRKVSGPKYDLPSGKTVDIEIRDSGETLIERKTVPLSPMGTFADGFSTNKEAEPGSYSITAKYGEDESTERVEIAAYRKPEYTVTVKPEKERYIRGDKVRFTVEAKYYYGSPVPGAKVQAHFNTSPTWSWEGMDEEDVAEFEEYEGYSSPDSYGGESIADVEATLDENGKAVIELDTGDRDAYAMQKWDERTDTQLSVIVDVNDQDKYVTSEGATTVARGTFDLGIHAKTWVSDTDKPIDFEVVSVKGDGKTPVPGARVKVVAGYRVWTQFEEKFFYQETQFVNTDRDGKVAVQIIPKHGGDLEVKAETQDERGNTIRSSTTVYVFAGAQVEEQYATPAEGLTLKLDKKQYRVGDSARVVLTTDRPGGYALLTVEGEKVYSHQIVRLTSKVNEIRLPVVENYRPNAYVAACAIENKHFHDAMRRLKIDLAEKTVNVRITPDKEVTRPGATATYTIRTLDAKGAPVSAEVSLGVVDESIYALAEDTTNLVRSFYPVRQHEVQTNYSFEQVYLDGGDKSPKDIQIRSEFKDTAFWSPFIETGPSGSAQIQVKLPDNLTSWRATAVAVTADTSVGMAKVNVLAKKDLMVRLQTPRYLVQGDTQRLVAIVTNESGADANVNVQLDPPPMPVQGDLRQTIRVPNGGTRPVEWTLTTPQTGDKTLIVRAWIDERRSDGEKKTIDVQPHGRLILDSQAGDVTATSRLTMTVRDGADRNTGMMTVTISPTLATTLVQALDELIDYPYGCVEQTLSRVVPTVVVARTVTENHLPGFKRMKEVPAIVAEGFTRLKYMQASNGAWGWWKWDPPDEGMTALVLEGLQKAADAGYPASGIKTKGAIDWLVEETKKPLPVVENWWYYADISDRLYAAYVLALYGRKDASEEIIKALPRKPLGPYEQSMLVLTYHAMGAGFTRQRDQALATMLSFVNDSQGLANWSERYWGYETTARCLLALARVQPHNPLIPKVVRYLLLHRRGYYWTSTRDSAYIVEVLAEWWRAVGGLATSGSLTMTLNGKPLRTFQFTPESLFDPDFTVRVPMSALSAGENRIEFVRSGPGACFYSAEMRQYVVEDRLAAQTTGAGLKVDCANYLLSPQPQEDGKLRLTQSKKPVTSYDRGDILRCEVNVHADKEMQYVIVEVPIPSNCHVTERTDIGWDETWHYDYCSFVIRDDRVALFLRTLDAGDHTYHFSMRAENPGQSSGLPAAVYNMYDPGVRASSAERSVEVHGR